MNVLMFLFPCRLQREEAKISAWENLQKAKAEAAIQKLEVCPFESQTDKTALFL